MSEENVELVKAALDALSRGDIEAVQAMCHPEAEIRPTISAIDAPVFRGNRLVAEWMSYASEVWEGYRMEFEAIIAHHDEYVIAVTRHTGRARGSGVLLDDRRYVVYKFKDGLMWRAKGFAAKEDALQAAGLPN